MITFTQTEVGNGAGHLLTAEAEVADGHVELIAAFENVYIEGDEPGSRELVGCVCTGRTVVLNDIRVLDPERARVLWAEAVGRP